MGGGKKGKTSSPIKFLKMWKFFLFSHYPQKNNVISMEE
jgi:hypothetical protein